MEISQELGIANLTKGLEIFRATLEQPSKNAKNPFLKNKYVNLEGVIKAVDKALKTAGDKAGITYSQEVKSDPEKNLVSVTTLISHTSGEWISFGPLSVPVGAKRTAQDYGSAITYAKRYALSAALGIASDIDDDGNEASSVNSERQSRPNNQRPRQSEPKVTPAMVKQIHELISKISQTLQIEEKTISDNTLAHFNVKSFSNMTQHLANEIIVYLGNALEIAREQVKQAKLNEQAQGFDKANS